MIKVQAINKKYKRQILKDISFEADKGQCIGILGANGCGKTTLLSIMAGVRTADSGEIYYNGKNIADNKGIIDKYVGYVPQENPLIEELSVKDNLRLWYRGNRKEFENQLYNGVGKLLGIDRYAKKTVSKLSGGMKRRLSIAIALINNASVLILDEPGAALDLICKAEIMDYLREYTKSGGTVVLTTHDEKEMELCDKIYIIKDGILKELNKAISGEQLIDQL